MKGRFLGRECFKNYDKDCRLVVNFMSAMLLIGNSCSVAQLPDRNHFKPNGQVI